MGVRLAVIENGRELEAVETDTEDDFFFFRDSVHMALEDGEFGAKFPLFMKAYFSDWDAADVPGLLAELEAIAAAFRAMPPEPLDGNWRAKLIRSGRKPASLADVYIDKDGIPLLASLIGLCKVARGKGLPISWAG